MAGICVRRSLVLSVLLGTLTPACGGGPESPSSPVAPTPIIAPSPLTSCQPNPTGPSLAALAPCCIAPNYVSEPFWLLRRWETSPVRVSIDSQSLSIAADEAPVYLEAIKEGLAVWSAATNGAIGAVEVDLDLAAADLVLKLSHPEGADDDCYFLSCHGRFAEGVVDGRFIRSGTILLYPANVGNLYPADFLRRSVAQLTGHEMGHALGLALHSNDERDLMFGRTLSAKAQAAYPWVTERDLNTMGTAYCR